METSMTEQILREAMLLLREAVTPYEDDEQLDAAKLAADRALFRHNFDSGLVGARRIY